jgi:hypothetical protein
MLTYADVCYLQILSDNIKMMGGNKEDTEPLTRAERNRGISMGDFFFLN